MSRSARHSGAQKAAGKTLGLFHVQISFFHCFSPLFLFTFFSVRILHFSMKRIRQLPDLHCLSLVMTRAFMAGLLFL